MVPGSRDDHSQAAQRGSRLVRPVGGDATAQTGIDPDQGPGAGEARRRLEEYGPDELPTEPPPSVWAVAKGQLANPMNITLLIVCAASFALVQIATAVVLGHPRLTMLSAPHRERTGQR